MLKRRNLLNFSPSSPRLAVNSTLFYPLHCLCIPFRDEMTSILAHNHLLNSTENESRVIVFEPGVYFLPWFQNLALFGALLFYIGMKNSMPRRQLRKKAPKAKTTWEESLDKPTVGGVQFHDAFLSIVQELLLYVCNGDFFFLFLRK